MEKITREYTLLFNSISDTIEKLDQIKEQLIFCQQLAEETYINKTSSAPIKVHFINNKSTSA